MSIAVAVHHLTGSLRRLVMDSPQCTVPDEQIRLANQLVLEMVRWLLYIVVPPPAY